MRYSRHSDFFIKIREHTKMYADVYTILIASDVDIFHYQEMMKNDEKEAMFSKRDKI